MQISQKNFLEERITIANEEYILGNYTEITLTFSLANDYQLIGFSGLDAINSNAILKDVLLIDLTETFGDGKEPSKEDFEIMLGRFSGRWFDGTGNIKTLKQVEFELTNKIKNANSFTDNETQTEYKYNLLKKGEYLVFEYKEVQ